MKLKSALALVGKYAVEGNYRAAVLRDGKIRACGPNNGIEVECEEATIGLAVDAVALLKMLKATKDPEIAAGKGRKLEITSGDSVFHLQAIPEAKEPLLPDLPSNWITFTAEETLALAAIAMMPDAETMAGLRLTPYWAAISDHRTCGVAWVKKIPAPACASVPPEMFKGLVGETKVALTSNMIFVQSEEQTRWSRLFAGEWPDRSVIDFVSGVRASANRSTVRVSASEVRRLAREAAAVADNPAQVFRLAVDGSEARLSGGEGAGAYGARKYDGAAPVAHESGPPPHHEVGIGPGTLALLAKVVEHVQVGDHAFLSIGGIYDPVVMWAGDPATEVLGMPQPLPGA